MPFLARAHHFRLGFVARDVHHRFVRQHPLSIWKICGPAFVQNGRPDATNLGAGPGFTVGNDKIGEDVAKFTGPPIKWGPEDVIVSSTGDFGITWGFIRPVTPPANGQPGGGPYTTIWRRAAPDQPWRYVAE